MLERIYKKEINVELKKVYEYIVYILYCRYILSGRFWTCENGQATTGFSSYPHPTARHHWVSLI